MPKTARNAMPFPFFFQERKGKLRYFEIYTYWCQNTIVAQSKLHPAFDNGVSIQDGYHRYIFAS